ncbi:hypothetical protein [Clostridium botulinum]|uniref:Uncharacterized protein n=1 Tax=Clostridium botulinum (strain Langeland / NCTC 10281 / Type F) TaxID=441772 RepID=A7GEH4_CLOBL|nr:hypothetical protein [Clostridium botulinum]ABS41715.1 hypothetical protein CLI_1926 [Clostridium botulinum F str. Langeland]KKM42824.1 hypothetical protein VT72_04070 [Clostridium botulinum]MBY6791659.1 hypothetical protein [Clostridium botulinum]MBY6936895.1 hypothetical protein [Clostridium botulinum]MBY6944315.1 hypothetical protein [Clostridium botulinum]
MIKTTLEEIENKREDKLGHLTKFLKSDGISLINNDIVTMNKHEVLETEDSIIVVGDAVVGELEEFIEGYSLKISKFGLLDWKEDWFSGAINLHYINSNEQLILEGERYV